jgi:hypothetical protein
VIGEKMTKSIWKDIPNFEGRYQITITGKVRSVKTMQQLTLFNNEKGYIRVYLYKKGKSHCLKVHRLVLETFVGSCPIKQEACHINGIRNDNRLSNLRWDTKVNNCRDRMTHGTFVFMRGEMNGHSKLKECEVLLIRTLTEYGISQRKIAKMFKIAQANVGAIHRKTIWKHI